ncbi:serine/threonine phosphatase [Lusitaniella coriacea]|nr:serine/threonine phosphatase [Lusitaniella coriacea]
MTALNQSEGNQGSSTMLVCPECQFENPQANRFCQQCGASLTQKNCHECGASVDWSAEYCEACGAFTAEGWWAIIADAESSKTPAPPAASETPPGEEEQSSVPPETSQWKLDSQERYKISAEHPEGEANSEESSRFPFVQTAVWDSQPLQKPFLEVLLEQQDELFEEIEESGNFSQLSMSSDFWAKIGVPAIALPYLILQESYSPSVPSVRDAWQYEGKGIVLLEDRCHWDLLCDRWSDTDVSLLQLLCWLDETVKLWEGFATIGYCHSLLEPSNLLVDEDQTLCVQQLYPDPPNFQPTLQTLSRMWQRLFDRSGRTLYDPLPKFLMKASRGEFETIEAVRSHLQAIASEQNIDLTEPDSLDIPMPSTTEEESPVLESPDVTGDPEKMIYQSSADDMPTVVLPMQLSSLQNAGYTDIGRQREHNEDHFGIETQIRTQENPLGKTIQVRGLYVVCDGMGGHAAGEVASALAVETLEQYFQTYWTDAEELPDEETILNGILAANQKIYDINQQNERSGSGRMGTTLVVALIQNTNIAIAHVGDSRIYRITRKRGLEQLTVDHEVGQREIQRGVDPEDAYARPDAYQLTQALGPRGDDFVKPDITFLDINEDTLLLLCSDGLSDNDLLENNFQTYLTPLISSKANIDNGLLELIDFANQHNGHDNITGLLVRMKVRPNTDTTRM